MNLQYLRRPIGFLIPLLLAVSGTYAQFGTVPAAFEGDLGKLFRENLHYPEVARDNGINGRVVVRFWVEVDGTTSGTEIVESGHSMLEGEALRMVSLMKAWRPAQADGKPVRTHMTVPIIFQADGGTPITVSRFPDHPTALRKAIPLTVSGSKRNESRQVNIFVIVRKDGVVEVPITTRANYFLKKNPIMADAAIAFFEKAGPFTPALDLEGKPVDFEFYLIAVARTEL